ncbi:CBS domain-containing protein [Bifidobacterium pseudocatenulatum]|nr:CBS domain-containing protein [Bifidobacterium pseudocatenulatum]
MERHHGQIPHGGADDRVHDRIRRHHAFGFTFGAFTGFWRMFPYNFTIALPIQMLIVAPLSGKIVHAIGDAAGWNKSAQQHVPALDVKTVADVMQHDVYTVASDATVRDAVRMMLEKNISGMPIVDDERHVVGFISDSDVLRRFAQDNAPVSDISTLVTGMARGEFPELSHAELLDMNVMVIAAKPAVTVQSDANIAQVCQMFDYQQYKKVPVVEQGKLVGVVNRGRLTRRSFEACLGTAE